MSIALELNVNLPPLKIPFKAFLRYLMAIRGHFGFIIHKVLTMYNIEKVLLINSLYFFSFISFFITNA